MARQRNYNSENRQTNKQREDEVFVRLKPLVQQTLEHDYDRATVGFDIEQALVELEDARRLAVNAHPPQVASAITAIMGKAKLKGMLVDQSIVGSPDDFRRARNDEEMMDMLERRGGARAVEAFKRFWQEIEQLDEEPVMIEDKRDVG